MYEDPEMDELDELDDEEAGEEESEEDAAIALALGSEDPDQIEAFKTAVRLCMQSYAGG